MIVNESIIKHEDGMSLNNVKNAIGKNNEYIKTNLTGKLADLNTKNKTSLVAAINEVFQCGSDFKTALADAIASSGGGGWRTLHQHPLMIL